MTTNLNPILFGTQRDYAWDAWQRAYAGNTGRVASGVEFAKWWDGAAAMSWASTHDLMVAAWNAGVAASAGAKSMTFDAWWQQILDAQPSK